jgi:glycosyltransferase involved in cell wall biosynthesis
VKVAIVSQYYAPEAVPIPSDLAVGLTERGHCVRVITGFPHYPAGHVFDGYRQRLLHVEDHGPVKVRRVPSFISHSDNALGRIANYLSFAVSTLTAGRHIRGADVIYVYATPMTAAIAPWIWRWAKRIPFVLHVQDIWPESVTGSTLVSQGRLNRVIAALLTPWLRQLYRTASATVTIAPTMAETLKERGLPEHASHIVFNWGNEPTGSDAPVAEPNSYRCTVMYAGNIGELQDLETVIRAAHAVGLNSGLRLVLCGTGVAAPRLKRLASELGAANVEFWDAVDRGRLAEIYAKSDYQVVPLKDLPIFKGTIPSKFQASLAFGVPVIATIRGDIQSIVEQNGLGFTAAPEDVGALEAVFRAALALSPAERFDMGRRAREFYYRTMSRDAGISRIEGLLTDVSRRSGTKGSE